MAQTVKPLRAKKGIDNDCRKKRLKKQKTSNKKVLNTFIWDCTTLKYHNCRFEKTQSTSNSNENNHNLLLFAFKFKMFRIHNQVKLTPKISHITIITAFSIIKAHLLLQD